MKRKLTLEEIDIVEALEFLLKWHGYNLSWKEKACPECKGGGDSVYGGNVCTCANCNGIGRVPKRK